MTSYLKPKKKNTIFNRSDFDYQDSNATVKSISSGYVDKETVNALVIETNTIADKTSNITQNAGVTTLTGTLNTLNVEIGVAGNSILGKNCGNKISSGTLNAIIGYESGQEITTGSKNTIYGTSSSNSAANSYNMDYSCAIGYGTNAIKSEAVSLGAEAHASTKCTSIGRSAGNGMWSQATNCTSIGYNAGSGYITNQTNKIYLGDANVDALYCNVQSISALSDERDKMEITDLNEYIDSTEYINNLRPTVYKMNPRMRYRNQCEDCDNNPVITYDENDGSKCDKNYSVGLIAQEVKTYEDTLDLPNDLLVDQMNENTLSIAYSKLIPILVQALKETNEKLMDHEKTTSILMETIRVLTKSLNENNESITELEDKLENDGGYIFGCEMQHEERIKELEAKFE